MKNQNQLRTTGDRLVYSGRFFTFRVRVIDTNPWLAKPPGLRCPLSIWSLFLFAGANWFIACLFSLVSVRLNSFFFVETLDYAVWLIGLWPSPYRKPWGELDPVPFFLSHLCYTSRRPLHTTTDLPLDFAGNQPTVECQSDQSPPRLLKLDASLRESE